MDVNIKEIRLGNILESFDMGLEKWVRFSVGAVDLETNRVFEESDIEFGMEEIRPVKLTQGVASTIKQKKINKFRGFKFIIKIDQYKNIEIAFKQDVTYVFLYSVRDRTSIMIGSSEYTDLTLHWLQNVYNDLTFGGNLEFWGDIDLK